MAEYFICNAVGESKDLPSEQDLRKFLRELDPLDEEHGAVWVGDREGNTLEFTVDGTLGFSRDGVDGRHLVGASQQLVLELWRALISARFDDLENQPWLAGPRPPVTPEKSARREREQAEWLRQQDREFYELLVAESETEPCRRDGCRRGHLPHSALCLSTISKMFRSGLARSRIDAGRDPSPLAASLPDCAVVAAQLRLAFVSRRDR